MKTQHSSKVISVHTSEQLSISHTARAGPLEKHHSDSVYKDKSCVCVCACECVYICATCFQAGRGIHLGKDQGRITKQSRHIMPGTHHMPYSKDAVITRSQQWENTRKRVQHTKSYETWETEEEMHLLQEEAQLHVMSSTWSKQWQHTGTCHVHLQIIADSIHCKCVQERV